jgi:hypothetical protein
MRLLAVIPALVLLLSVPMAGRQSAPPFRFDADNLWMSLHHFLYVLGRDAAEMPDRARAAVAGAPADQTLGLATLTPDERVVWLDAVRAYAGGLSRRDAVFDAPLVSVTRALAGAGARSASELTGVPDETRAILARVEPLYRRAWWPAHQRANSEWAAAMQPLIDRYGAEVLTFVTRAYSSSWPADGYPVNVVPYANWAGAYSTTGDLLVLSSLTQALGGPSGLEILFHEAMHQWDEEVDRALKAAGERAGVEVPGNLSHALIFYTAGEAVRRAVSGHVPYAEANGIWLRGMGPFKPAIEAGWRPWLDGRGTRDQALATVLARLAG